MGFRQSNLVFFKLTSSYLSTALYFANKFFDTSPSVELYKNFSIQLCSYLSLTFVEFRVSDLGLLVA